MAGTGKWDFFVSYTEDDRAWAEWIAWTLEASAYRVLIQAWDMVPGTNWVFAVDEGIRHAERTIAVVSRAYLESDWARLEALGALHRDPLGRQRRLLAVGVDECHPVGPLGMITRIDVFGLPEADARRALLDGVGQAIRGRGKPGAQGPFPGQARKVRFPDGTAPSAGEHRICVALDVEDYRQLPRGDREQVRGRVLAMLLTALGRAGVRNHACVVIDRVDGLALILPASFRGPAATTSLVSELCAGIARIGLAAKEQPPIRSRVGVAAGTVDLKSWTFEGSATAAARLLVSCGQVRVAAGLSGRTPNAVVVADGLYLEAAAAAVPAGFTRIPVSADAYGWISLIPGRVPAPVSSRTPVGAAALGGAALGGAAAAAVITGRLAAEEWQHLVDHEDALAAAGDRDTGDHAIAGEIATGDGASEPWPDQDDPDAGQWDTDQGAGWGEQPNPWAADAPSSPWDDAMDDDGGSHDGSDAQVGDDISGGLWDN